MRMKNRLKQEFSNNDLAKEDWYDKYCSSKANVSVEYTKDKHSSHNLIAKFYFIWQEESIT